MPGKRLAEIVFGEADAAAKAGCILDTDVLCGRRSCNCNKRADGSIRFAVYGHADVQRKLHRRTAYAARLSQQFEARRGRTGGQRRCNRLAVTFASECGYPLAVGFPSDIRAAAEVFAPFAVCLITAVDRGGNNGRAAAVTTAGAALTAIL